MSVIVDAGGGGQVADEWGKWEETQCRACRLYQEQLHTGGGEDGTTTR